MRISWVNIGAIAASVLAVGLIAGKNVGGSAAHQILNVSYDPTRELYQRLNPVFIAKYEKETGENVGVRQSHGGSSYQARQVANGEQTADVVTLGLPSDVEGLEKRGLIKSDWRGRLPDDAQPYHSTIVFVVRKDNPLNIRDWPDLIRPGVEIITPDPKTSGNGKLTALSAWGYVVAHGGDEFEAHNFLKKLYDHAPFLVPAARAAGVAFAIEKKGDVNIAWENEALREVDESKGALEIVYPSISILAEPSVAWVDANVEKHKSAALAEAYLRFLFTEDAQEIIAREGYRPSNEKVLARHADRLPEINLFPITLIAKSWSDAQQKFFAENGVIDTFYVPKPRSE
ncbi:sulfate ABC transporter substrate-binding protein [Methylocystis parvus]|uniref:Sulfate ABC transporter substrate-binding protein n=1 Tax=Methylocystis parvus TaxID=134 RepID=A0A6B8M9L9_9HYPH|nr:sulfate ABC transporter substrate-binding protein [Methylocystis parvus]QGM97410.1 sulfate ABC transporter substrate-binding protein [Methylocystis parvus]WBJ98677.1 sulfate ABC transporter substrate-binding protein [Methylocystis parvus OBBP]